jgi:hypothetical protein
MDATDPRFARLCTRLGADHVAHVLRLDHAAEHCRGRAHGAWLCNDVERHGAYLALAELIEGRLTPATSGAWSAMWRAYFTGQSDRTPGPMPVLCE